MKATHPFDEVIVFDLETTGCDPERNQIIEIGAIKVKEGCVVSQYQQLIDPQIIIPDKITEITGITNDMVQHQPSIEEVLPDFINFCEGDYILGHNILFDYKFIKANALRYGYPFVKQGFDTLRLARRFLKHLPSRSLGVVCDYYGINLVHAHRAYDDAKATYEVFLKLKEQFYTQFPEEFKPEPMTWVPKKQAPITMKQKKSLQNLLRMQKKKIHQELDMLTKSEASRFIDEILKEMRQAK